MADVQRWDLPKKQLDARFNTSLYEDKVGRYVRYSDHLAAVKVLRDALQNVAFRKFAGQFCWCAEGMSKHQPYCLQARAALAADGGGDGK